MLQVGPTAVAFRPWISRYAELALLIARYEGVPTRPQQAAGSAPEAGCRSPVE
jgi:hypothetical protein